MNARNDLPADPPGPDGFDPFAAGAVERVIATSAVQREVWLADRLGREASLAFNESVAVQLTGALDVDALQTALAAVVARHAALRSTITPDGLQMLVGAPIGLPCPVSHLRALSAADRRAAVARASKSAVETPFDLEHGPLFRAELLRLADAEHRLLLTAHHIVCDGWSWGVIVADLAGCYAEAIGDGPSSAPPPGDYEDYVRWELAENSGPGHAAHRQFWLERFAGAGLPVLDLPTDRARAARRTFRSGRVDADLPPDLVESVQRAGAGLGASLFATLFCAFAAVLHRLTGQSDIVIGVPSAGQSASGLTGLVGHCVNLLPIRTDPLPDEPFSTYLERASNTLLDAFDHPALSYGTLLTMLPVQRDPSRLPLVSVMFNVDPDGGGATADKFPGLAATISSVPRSFENFELFVNAVRQPGGGMRLECQYNADLFDEASIDRWLGAYRTLLHSATLDGTVPIGALRLQTEEGEAALLAFQGPRLETPAHELMHSAFLRRCRLDGARNAVDDGRRRLSYDELDRRSNRLAHALRGRGARRGARIGLKLPRNADLLVALLGVLKSGASYVPLDPAFPAARLAFYAEDAKLLLELSEGSIESLCAGQPEHALAPSAHDATPADTAYLIYTSGSTGRPKGVSVPHGAVANFIAGMQLQPGLAATDRLAAVTTLSFDIAVLELLLPLAVGAEVLLVPREVAIDGRLLGAALADGAATAMQATPGMWRSLVDAGWRGGPRFKALVGGESLPRDLAQALLQRAGEVWNLYGPTETTVWSTLWRVEPAMLAERGVSIGRPIANTTVWILDGAGHLCPPGVAGEICIGGDGVALGYFERPELTAQRFVADRFAASPGARLYRTGDRGRWRHDGLLEHLGRLDLQVKVRGYRIEPAEIEACCDETAGVSRSVVLVREDHPGDARLVAYLTMAAGAALDEPALRAALRSRLPDYMVPQHVVVLDALPLLPNGKIDRAALPAPASAPRPRLGERVAPRSELERLVLSTMEAVLKLPELGVDDDFFALGGHSLLAAQLASRLHAELGRPVPMAALFEAPTAARLAVVLAETGSAGPAEAIAHDPTLPVAPLTPMQERIRFIEELYPGEVTYNTPSGHRLRGPFDAAAFGRAFAAMVARQPALRTTIAAAAGGGFEQRVAPTLELGLPLIDLSGEPAATREARLMAAMREVVARPLDIHALPLFHAVLYRLGADEHVFLFVPHHIVWDGWSFDILYEELSALYAAEVDPSAVVPPPPVLSPADFARWYARWLQGDEAARQLGHWKRRFAAVDTPRALPTDHPRAAGMIGTRGAWQTFDIDAALAARLQAAARSSGLTLSMLSMLVLAVMLGRLAGSPGIVVGLPVRGRQHGDFERTMGFFNNLLPIPVDVDPALPLSDAAARLKRATLDALAHQDVPFERLSSEPEIAVRATPSGLYQVTYSFQDLRGRPTAWGPLTHERVAVFQDAVTEELGLWLTEHDHGLSGAVTYNLDVFDRSTAEALQRRFCELLARVADADFAACTVAALAEPAGSAAASSLAELADRSAARAAAPAPVSGATSSKAVPQGREAVLAQVWADLLSIDVRDIRAGDNFFDLGGDSLLVMRAVEAGVGALGERVDARRYIYESLAQLAVPTARPSAAKAPPPTLRGHGGWLRRVFAAVSLR